MYALKQIANNTRVISSGLRAFSNSSRLVDITVDKDEIATVTMQRPPVNSLNLELLENLSETLDEVEKRKCKGMILTSSSSTTFCAGLDLIEIYKPDIKRAEKFWWTYQDVWIKLFGSNFITAAAINGHAPAGGCMLAMSCEYRVMMSGKYTMGLNEAFLGLIVTDWFITTMRHTMNNRQTELAITTGKMFTADEALKVGLIDEASTNKEDTIKKCKECIYKFDRVNPRARAITKKKIREDVLRQMQENRVENLEECMRTITNTEIQQALHTYIQKMQQRKTVKS